MSTLLTVGQYLKLPIPDAKYDKWLGRPSVDDSLDSNINFDVKYWSEFREDVKSYNPPIYNEKLRYKERTWLEWIIDKHNMVGAVVNKFVSPMDNVKNDDEHFCCYPSVGEKLLGLQPGFVCIQLSPDQKDVIKIYFVLDYVEPDVIKTQEENLVDLLSSSECRKSVKQIVRRIYLYLAEPGLKYAALTTYFQTWFFKFENDTLYISDTFNQSGCDPSVRQCLAYFMELGRKSSHEFKLPECLTGVRSNVTCYDESKDSQIGDVIELRGFREFRRTGPVYEGKCGSFEFEFKICYHFRQRKEDLYGELMNETKMYSNYLKELQGKFIPKFYFTWKDDYCYGLAFQSTGQPIVVKELTSEQKEKIVKALSEIHKLKVVHNDLREKNILVSNDGGIYFTHFVWSEFNSSQEELNDEMNLLKNLIKWSNEDE